MKNAGTDDTTPVDIVTTLSQVVSELIALDWPSHGAGATVPEIVAALEIRGITVSVADVIRALAGCLECWRNTCQRRGGWPVIRSNETAS